MDGYFFRAALGAYLVSTVGYAVSLWIRRVAVAKAATWLLFAAFVMQGVAIGLRWIQMRYGPAFGGVDVLAFLAWVMTGGYLVLQFRTKTRVLGCFVAPVASLFMIVSSVRPGGAISVPENLRGGLVSVHVFLSVTGEALFALAALAGCMYLLQDRFIKQRRFTGWTRYLPPLRDLDRINHLCLLWGFPLLTAGILVGSLWARTVWGSPWQWDPKQVWTLLAWGVAALLVHQRLAIGWKGRRAAVASVLALGVLSVALVMERFCFTTVHSFL